MTPRERLGKRLFVILATVIVLSKLGAALEGALYGAGGVEWHQLVLAPSLETLATVAVGLLRHWLVALGLAVAVAFLWRGNDLLRRVVGVACVLSGATTLFIFLIFARDAGDLGFFDPFFAFEYAHGLVEMFAGLALLFLPSLRAFFQYQRAERPAGVAGGRRAPAWDDDPQPLPSPVMGGMWGALLGGASGFALSRVLDQHYGLGYAIAEAARGLLHEAVASMLAGILVVGVLGLVAGVAAGIRRPRPEQSLWRFAMTRGLIAAAVCVMAMTLSAGTLAGLSGERVAPIFGPPAPGLPTGALVALLALVTMGPPLGVVAFLLGVGVAVLLRDS